DAHTPHTHRMAALLAAEAKRITVQRLEKKSRQRHTGIIPLGPIGGKRRFPTWLKPIRKSDRCSPGRDVHTPPPDPYDATRT
ncbi:MAG: hypothetical protein V3T70_00440, partial [Phycisphaerae bacterium]